MNLKKFYNTKVNNIITNTGMKFDGVVTDYFHPDENETGKESIVIDSSNGSVIEFYEDDIKEIENFESYK